MESPNILSLISWVALARLYLLLAQVDLRDILLWVFVVGSLAAALHSCLDRSLRLLAIIVVIALVRWRLLIHLVVLLDAHRLSQVLVVRWFVSSFDQVLLYFFYSEGTHGSVSILRNIYVCHPRVLLATILLLLSLLSQLDQIRGRARLLQLLQLWQILWRLWVVSLARCVPVSPLLPLLTSLVFNCID